MRVEVEVEQGGFGPVAFEFTVKVYKADYSVMAPSTAFEWEYTSDPVYTSGFNKGRKVSPDVLDVADSEIEQGVVRAVERWTY